MTVTLEIPDELAARLGGDIARRALEALAVQEMKAGRMHKAELRRLLGFSWHETEAFLKAHEVYEEYTIEEIREQVEAIRRVIGR